MRLSVRIAIVVSVLFAAANIVSAQGGNQGVIAGTVTDQAGAVVQGAELTATHTATGASFKTASKADGFFEFPLLPVGLYDLAVTKQGFAALTEKDVKLTIGAKLSMRLELKVSGTTETVVVTGEAPVVETTRTQVSATVDDQAVANLPTNGRNFIDFVLLTPGVNRDVRGGDLSFAGQRGTLNSLTVDGTDNNNTFFGQTLGRTGSGRAPYQFSQDAVQEFQVNTNGYSAEFGRAGGAVINVVTKSGTNAFHGTAFEFFRDRALNANDPIYDLQLAAAAAAGRALPIKPGYHFNQFGGNIGGPIVKSRAFFFFDYDGQRNNTGNPVLVTLPTPVNAFQTAAVNYLSQRNGNYSRTFNQDVYLAKVDYTISGSHQLSGRYNAQRFTGQAQENSGITSAFEHTGASNVNTDTIGIQETATFTPNLLNIARFSYQRDNEPGLANSINPEANVRNFLFVGRNSFSPRETTIHRQQYGDTLSWIHGRHTFKFGGDILRDTILNFFPGNFSGAYTFTGLDDFGRSLLGVPVTNPGNSFTEAYPGPNTTGATTHPNLWQYAAFAQDDWKVTRNLTLNLGLRYDVQLAAQPGVQNPTAIAQGLDTSKIPNDTNNIAPRVGFAWQPLKAKAFVVRGGYGLFYGNTPSIMYGTADSNNGINVQTLTFNASNVPLVPLPASYPNVTCGAPQQNAGCPLPTATSLPAPTIFVFAKNYQQPYVEQYNLGLEYQLAANTSVSVGYLGVHGVHIQRTRDINEPRNEVPSTIVVNGTGQVLTFNKLSGLRPFTGFARIFEFESNAGSNYNGMVLQLNKRFAHNFSMLGSYTWSHVIDDAPDATAVVPGTDDAKMVSDPNNVRLDRSNGNNDVRHRFILSSVWDLNYARGIHNSFLKALAEGWQLTGILNAQSGEPYSALVSTDLNGDGNSRTDRAPGFGRNTFNMPAIIALDPRVSRTIRFSERARLQLIAEAFNVLNHQNITGVRNTFFAFASTVGPTTCSGGVTPCLLPQTVGTVGVNAFGVPSSANVNGQGNVGRVLQLAAKISF